MCVTKGSGIRPQTKNTNGLSCVFSINKKLLLIDSWLWIKDIINVKEINVQNGANTYKQDNSAIFTVFLWGLGGAGA